MYRLKKQSGAAANGADPLKVLVLCTGNSCRSVMAQALINNLGGAGIGHAVPEVLQRHGVDPGQIRSKSWNEFAEESFDLVITVCDQAVGESCPLFSGNPKKLHWSTPDPVKAAGSEADKAAAFDKAFFMLKSRVEELMK